MCFNIHKEHPKAKTAKQDIVCYKRFNRGSKSNSYFESPVREYKYTKGDCYHEDAMRVNDGEITKGLHSHSNLENATFRRWSDEIVVKCVIPEGAKYYFNPSNCEYVSDYLIIGTNEDIVIP